MQNKMPHIDQNYTLINKNLQICTQLAIIIPQIEQIPSKSNQFFCLFLAGLIFLNLFTKLNHKDQFDILAI